jgi:carbonic anhydrase
VVLGHSDCGAVHATLAALEAPREGRTLHLPAILERIRPAVEPLLDEPGADH